MLLQAQEAQAELGWSLILFNSRLETYCQHYARKRKRRRERSGDSGSEEDTTNETKRETPVKSSMQSISRKPFMHTLLT